MHAESDPLIEWVEAAFPEFSWQGADRLHGAFHEVVISQSWVARIAHGEGHQARAQRERSSLTLIPAVCLPVDVPEVLSEVVTTQQRSGLVVSRVPGSAESASDWATLRDGYQQLLDALAAAPSHMSLSPARTWCGGADLITIVAEEFGPQLQGRTAAATKVIEDMMNLPRSASPVLVHGDFGPHNILWNGATAVSLIDFDHACIDDHAIDVAPLVGRYGANKVTEIVSDELLSRAMVHRASLSLQVAAAAHLAGNKDLRDHALSNFTQRHEAGTLYDPEGCMQ